MCFSFYSSLVLFLLTPELEPSVQTKGREENGEKKGCVLWEPELHHQPPPPPARKNAHFSMNSFVDHIEKRNEGWWERKWEREEGT